MTPHFPLRVLTASETAARYGIDNAPGPEALANLARLAALLEEVRVVAGPVEVTSGFRCPALNERVGGVSASAHVEGRAADLQAARLSAAALAARIEASAIAFDQLILEFGRWVHLTVAAQGAPPRREVLTARKEEGRTVYLPGLVG